LKISSKDIGEALSGIMIAIDSVQREYDDPRRIDRRFENQLYAQQSMVPIRTEATAIL
jgi:hypothetical protein